MQAKVQAPASGAAADKGNVPARLLARLRDQRGLSMIELLVVILIVLILAAIAIASFMNTRSTAQDREAMTAVRTARLAIEIRHQNTGSYAATKADLVELDRSLSDARDLEIDATADAFELTVASRSGSKGGGAFTISRDADGKVTRTCANPGRGGCKPVADASGSRW